MRTMFWLQIVLAAADGQLGEQQAAAAAGRALTTQFSNFSADPRAILHTRLQGLWRTGCLFHATGPSN
jgi:hypothetical protein